MTRHLTIDNTTKFLQRQASDPSHSAWVSANAGSGKTYVLSRRVVRLLLDGTDPSRILCLTFTKAAAGEMSNRVFEILGSWVAMSDEVLATELETMEGETPSATKLNRARTLFARALETPGGLKIQTIHAFCEALLHQFPLEANIPGNFSVMDDPTQKHLMEDAYRAIILDADQNPQGETGHAFARIMEAGTDTAIEKAIADIVSNRDGIIDWIKSHGGVEAAMKSSRQVFGFKDDDRAADFVGAAVSESGFEKIDCVGLADLCATLKEPTAQGFGDKLRAYAQAQSNDEKFDILCNIALTKSGSPRSLSKFPPKSVVDVMPTIRDVIADDADRLIAARNRINLLLVIEATSSLMVLAQGMIETYQRSKRLRGLLDFDDLVSRTADLLSASDARAWVLYKLDLGIDHILLDEAQDTSPRQWQVISSLVDEFFSGESARKTERTLFAVGDEKQSIYSFQGAVPESFALQKRKFDRQAEDVKKTFKPVGLNLSFRSTADILGAVDAVFSHAENGQGLTFDGQSPPHTAARKNDPGCVDVWPLIRGEDTPVPENWHTPLSATVSQHQAIQLAEKMADQIAIWIGRERLEATGRPIQANDILVLVRARDRFVGALTRALKDRKIPVAGADRLAITDHIAVMDLMALGQIMVTPEDDLSLACVLKSPLIGLSEEELLKLSRSRLHEKFETSLFEALQTIEDPAFEQAREKILNWRSQVDRLPVYEFYAQVLGVDRGRTQFYQRLGMEAEDVLDAFLAAALAQEQNGLPGLQAFLHRLNDEKPIIKREMDRSAGDVRIMTVHAAKGLEAPIVFLVDKCSPAFIEQHAPALYAWEEHNQTGYFWVPSASHQSETTRLLKDAVKRKAEDEYKRLLYVGMTRAEDRLIVCGYGPKRSVPKPNWHDMVSTALEPDWEEFRDAEGALLWSRWKSPDSPEPLPQKLDETTLPKPHGNTLPEWIFHKLSVETTLPRPLNPSGAQALIDDELATPKFIPSLLSADDDTVDVQTPSGATNPRKRGTAVHALLQFLPAHDPQTRWEQAARYLDHSLPESPPEERQALLDTVQGVLESDELAACFDPKTSKAEVPLMGTLNLASGQRSVSGIIDRLAVVDDQVIILDYKTNSYVPATQDDVSQDYLIQMALYRTLISQIYPTKTVRTALVWTHDLEGPKTMFLSNDLLDDALSSVINS